MTYRKAEFAFVLRLTPSLLLAFPADGQATGNLVPAQATWVPLIRPWTYVPLNAAGQPLDAKEAFGIVLVV